MILIGQWLKVRANQFPHFNVPTLPHYSSHPPKRVFKFFLSEFWRKLTFAFLCECGQFCIPGLYRQTSQMRCYFSWIDFRLVLLPYIYKYSNGRGECTCEVNKCYPQGGLSGISWILTNSHTIYWPSVKSELKFGH